MTDVSDFMRTSRVAIVDRAAARLRQSNAPHYRSVEADELRDRLDALYGHMLDAIATRDLEVVEGFATGLARERFESGFGLEEVQTAFNALEESAWSTALENLEPASFAEALGLVTTALGAGKDALAREYVSRAAHVHSPSLDLRALFAGSAGA